MIAVDIVLVFALLCLCFVFRDELLWCAAAVVMLVALGGLWCLIAFLDWMWPPKKCEVPRG